MYMRVFILIIIDLKCFKYKDSIILQISEVTLCILPDFLYPSYETKGFALMIVLSRRKYELNAVIVKINAIIMFEIRILYNWFTLHFVNL